MGEDVAQLGTTQYDDDGPSFIPSGSRAFLTLYSSTVTIIEGGLLWVENTP